MEIVFSNRSNFNNDWSTFYCSMVKQKLELTFNQGFWLGMLVCLLTSSMIIDKFFVSKEVFFLKRIYVDGRIYKLCEDR
jgi:hypothetical protein